MADTKAMLTRDGLLGERNPDAEFWHRFWDLRGIGEYPCRACNGTGRRTYSSTATYFGGIGGQALTDAECNRCWGTGDDAMHGANLKELHLAARAARKAAPRE